MAFYPVGTFQESSFVSQHRVNGCNNRHIRAEITVITDCNNGIILDCKIEVEETVSADSGVAAIVKAQRPMEQGSFTYLSQ